VESGFLLTGKSASDPQSGLTQGVKSASDVKSGFFMSG
jgi:hypothetical protein